MKARLSLTLREETPWCEIPLLEDVSPRNLSGHIKAILTSIFSFPVEMRPELEARWQAQKEAWERQQREEREARAGPEPKNPSDADNDTNGKANGKTAQDGNADVQDQTNGVHEADSSARDADNGINGDTIEDGIANVHDQTNGFHEVETSPGDAEKNDTNLLPVIMTKDGNAVVQGSTNVVHEFDTSASAAENDTNLQPVTTAEDEQHSVEVMAVDVPADSVSTIDAEENITNIHPVTTAESEQPNVEVHADDVPEDGVSTIDTGEPVYTPPTTHVPTIIISSDDSDSDTIAASDLPDDQPAPAFIAPRHTSVYETVIYEFGNRGFWHQVHTEALACSALKRKLVLVRLCHLACLRNFAVPKIQERQGLLGGKTPILLVNHFAWVRFIARYPSIVNKVMKYVAWLELLENEYAQALPYWESFWTAMEDGEPPAEGVLEALSQMNVKRLFLQTKVIAEEHVVDDLDDENAPTWIEWDEGADEEQSVV